MNSPPAVTFGYRPRGAEDPHRGVEFIARASRPLASTTIDLRAFAPPARFQGTVGACTGFCARGALRGLMAAATASTSSYAEGHVVSGVIGSSDMWNSELDRIARFHEAYGTSAEEMEAAAAAQVAELNHVPFLAVRVLSNNITNAEPYRPGVASGCSTYVLAVVRTYLSHPAH